MNSTIAKWMLTQGSTLPPMARPSPPGRESESPEPRRMPHSIEAEQQLLGCVFADNEVWHRVADRLKGDDFFEPVHGRIWNVASRVIMENRIANPVTLRASMHEDAALKELGGQAYMVNLMRGAVSHFAAPEYAETIAEMSRRRRLIFLSREIEDKAVSGEAAGESAATIAAAAERGIVEMTRMDETGRGFQTLGLAASEAMRQANEAYRLGGRINGSETGIADLDGMLGGFGKSDLVIVAGRPAMGKTALATTIALNIARAGEPVAFFSLEMSAAQLANRLIAAAAGLPADSLRRGKLDEADFRRALDAARGFNAPLFIDDSSSVTALDLTTRARRIKRVAKGLGAIFVDYLGLLQSEGRGRPRVEEVSEITRSLKILARDMDVPVVALSQLSRDVERRENKRPVLSDLRDSGSIEQDADVVMFVYREEYYLERSEPNATEHEDWLKWQSRMEAAAGIAEVIVGKNRHGRTGAARLHFDAQTARFTDAAPEGLGTQDDSGDFA